MDCVFLVFTSIKLIAAAMTMAKSWNIDIYIVIWIFAEISAL